MSWIAIPLPPLHPLLIRTVLAPQSQVESSIHPAEPFAPHPPAYDPRYHFELAIAAGCNAYAAPLGFLEAGAREFAGEIPLILKANDRDVLLAESYHVRIISYDFHGHCTSPLNPLPACGEGRRSVALAGWGSSDLISNQANMISDPTQALTGSVEDALRLGCVGIGFTIYPGSAHRFEMYQQIRACAEVAKRHGLVVMVWSYARGSGLSKVGETAIDKFPFLLTISTNKSTSSSTEIMFKSVSFWL